MRTFILAPFSPIAVNNVFNRFNLASSRFEVEGVEGVVGDIWLYGIPFECHPHKRCVLIVFGSWKICLSPGIHDTTYTTAPILQECSFEEHVGNGWVLWEGMMWLLDGLCGQLLRQMTWVLNLNAVIIDGNADRTACVVEQPMTKRMPSLNSPVIFFSSNVRVSSPCINACIYSIVITAICIKSRHKDTTFSQKESSFEAIAVKTLPFYIV